MALGGKFWNCLRSGENIIFDELSVFMIEIQGKYAGKKFVDIEHPSGTLLRTDAPKDNLGEGSSFSPTDLVAAALGSCILTIMLNMSERSGWDLSGARFRVEKHMSPDSPRRIVALPIDFHLPKALPAEARVKLELAAKSCPVHHSLHPDIQVIVSYFYDL